MKIIDLLFPRNIRCFVCGVECEELGVCDYCYPKLNWIRGDVCEKCGGLKVGRGKVCLDCKGRDYYFYKNFCIFNYEDIVQRNIIKFKNGGGKYLGEVFAYFIKNAVKSIKVDFDVIIPVPIHKNRRKERGFNQSEILSSKLDEYNVGNNILTRVVDTPHQTGLGRNNREENLLNAFEVLDKEKVKGKTILLIDDIYTTGSTINECAKTLVNNGASVVYSLCLARAPMNKKENIVK